MLCPCALLQLHVNYNVQYIMCDSYQFQYSTMQCNTVHTNLGVVIKTNQFINSCNNNEVDPECQPSVRLQKYKTKPSSITTYSALPLLIS